MTKTDPIETALNAIGQLRAADSPDAIVQQLRPFLATARTL